MWLITALFAAGIIGGFLAGLLGIGGGIIYVLILPYALHISGISNDFIVQFTIANSIFGILFASFSASLVNLYSKDFYIRDSVIIGIFGALSSLLVTKLVVIQSWYIPAIFNGLLVVMLAYMLITAMLNKSKPTRQGIEKRENLKFGLAGLAGGVVSSLTGLGGGAVVVPILTLGLKMDIKKAKSISLVMIFMISLALTLLNLVQKAPEIISDYQVGYIHFPIALPLSIGVLVGSPTGVRIAQKLSSRIIAIIFGIFLCIVISEKLYQFIAEIF